ncbi:MAG: hypothetical protein WCR51_05480 [Planctomycetia bacterium]
MRGAGRAFLIGAALAGIAAARADALDAEVGLGGVHRTGTWTPIVVTLPQAEPAGGPWHVWVEDPDGQWVRSPAVVSAVDDGAARLRFRARFGRPAGGVQVEGPADGGGVSRTFVAAPPALAADEQVILVIGELDAAERAARLMAREDGSRPRVIRVADPRALAAGAMGITARDLDGVDRIMVCGNALPDTADGLARDVLAAIDGWVHDGGSLVFIAGESATRVAVPGSTPARWLPGPLGEPGRVDRLVPLRRSAALETFGRAGRPLDKAALAGLQAPLLADTDRLDGTVVAFEGRSATDLPLVVRSVRGFGTITWLGIDVDRPAFRSWPGTDTLLVELLEQHERTTAGGRAGESARGALDLAGQLRAAVDRFSGVAPVPFELIAGLGLLYVACLYPLDWWLTSRGGRPALAWISLPVIVALFSGLAWGAGKRWKGTEWHAATAGIVDVDAVSGLVRARSWTGTWSPANVSLDVDAAPAAAAATQEPDIAVSWCAAAGRGLGGTDSPTPHPALGAHDYRYADGLADFVGVPIAADASRLFEADWTARSGARGAPAVIAATLERDAQAALRGVIESRLPFPLEGCVLVHAGWLYDVGRLERGGRFEPAAGRGPRSLAGALTRRAAAKDRDVAERWDTASTDVERILEIAGLYRAAGGSAYTSLDAGRLARLDLSPVLDTGRAVLIGRGPAGTDWRIQAGTGHDASTLAPAAQTAIWRFVLPLEPRQP